MDPSKFSNQIEEAIFNHTSKNANTKDSWQQYVLKIRQIAFNINKNSSLLRNILEGNVRIEKLPDMSAKEMESKEAQKKKEEMLINMNEGRRTDWVDPTKEIRGLSHCPGCKSYKTEHHQLQILCADEPMTT